MVVAAAAVPEVAAVETAAAAATVGVAQASASKAAQRLSHGGYHVNMVKASLPCHWAAGHAALPQQLLAQHVCRELQILHIQVVVVPCAAGWQTALRL